MKKNKKNIIITGGAGFIGSHLACTFVKKYPEYNIINIDNLSYASDLDNLNSIKSAKNYAFYKIDIRDESSILNIFKKYKIDNVIHLAAESHVDNSILNPIKFADTNVIGTLNLLDIARKYWNSDFQNKCFFHVSTDEVYGSLGNKGSFTEKSAYNPRSPYSASKAASDHFVCSYNNTFGMPTLISNCSNNFGPHQFEEKLIPLMITKIFNEEKLPIYGNGQNVRDWLFVEDHIDAIDLIFHKGTIGENYNIGGDNELKNIDVINELIIRIDKNLSRPKGYSKKLISFINDRMGHDYRYSINSNKLKKQLGWAPKTPFELGLDLTIDWYIKKLKKLN